MKEELKAEIARLIDDATGKDAQEGLRSDLFDRFMGEPVGDEVDGRSKFIDTTVSDAIESIMPDLMDIFVGARNLVEFSPVGPEDEAAAKQETGVVSHIFWQKNAGYEIVYTWCKEALTQQNAYVWSGWDERERVCIEEYEDLTLLDLMALLYEKDGYDILEQSGFEMVGDEPAQELDDEGQPAPIAVKIRYVKTEKEYLVEAFPQEEFFCSPRWNKVSLDGVRCHGRRREMELEDLVAMGFDRETIENAGEGSDEEQKTGRHSTKGSNESEGDDDLIRVHEAYMRLDPDEKGRLSLYRVWLGHDGNKVLKWKDGTEAIEEVSRGPISALTPYIVPHRHIGRAVAELVESIQAVKTVLIRQMLDSTYLTNYGRPYFDENDAGAHTMADLAKPKPGSPVRTGGAEINWHYPQPIAQTVLPLLEKFDQLKEERVGATRYNQGLDADSLNKTVGGMQMIQNASQKKVKLIARTLAETGFRDLFQRIHADLRSGPWKEIAVKLYGQWTNVSPTTWRDRTDMTVEVGMGRGDRDEQRAGLTMLGQVQRELMASGSRMVTEQHLYATITRVLGTFGIDHTDEHIANPADLPPPPPPQAPPPDPMMASVQVQAKKNDSDAQIAKMKLQMEEMQRQRDHDHRMLEAHVKSMAEDRQQAKTASDIQTDEERLELDKRKAVMADDLERDKALIQGAPPVSYESVTE